MLAGIYYGAQYGGTITSVLLRLPGEASSVVTVFDGFALAKQGKAGTALGIAAIGSFVGATISIIGLTLLAPIVASIALDFGPPEYAALALLGVLLVATIGSGNKLKALIAGLDRAAAGHRRSRQLQRRFAFHVRQPATRRRHRLRRRGDGPVRCRRDPLQPRAAAPQDAAAGQGRQRVAVAQGSASSPRAPSAAARSSASSSACCPAAARCCRRSWPTPSRSAGPRRRSGSAAAPSRASRHPRRPTTRRRRRRSSRC